MISLIENVEIAQCAGNCGECTSSSASCYMLEQPADDDETLSATRFIIPSMYEEARLDVARAKRAGLRGNAELEALTRDKELAARLLTRLDDEISDGDPLLKALAEKKNRVCLGDVLRAYYTFHSWGSREDNQARDMHNAEAILSGDY